MPSQQASSSCCINPHLFFQLHGWVVTRAYIHLWCDRRSDGSCLGGKAGGGRHGDSLPYSIFPGPSLPPAPESPLERPSWDGDAGRMLPAPLVQPAPFTQLDARAQRVYTSCPISQSPACSTWEGSHGEGMAVLPVGWPIGQRQGTWLSASLRAGATPA